MGKKCGKFKFFSKSLDKSRFISTKSRFISTKSRLFTNISKNLVLSRFVSKVSISLDDLDKNLDTSLSRLKSLDFKNLDRDKMKVDLDRRENLDGFQKLVSTLRTFSISISICLDVETTRLTKIASNKSGWFHEKTFLQLFKRSILVWQLIGTQFLRSCRARLTEKRNKKTTG
jgi:hypothetical protein